MAKRKQPEPEPFDPLAAREALNARHARTLTAIFERPNRSDIRWKDIEGLFLALGGEIQAGSGSRRRVKLGIVRSTFHRPHPSPFTDKGAVTSVRGFLAAAGVEP